MTQAIEKSAMAKIYMRLLPFAILSYFLAYVDRINVSFAALTMRDDLQMSASALGLFNALYIHPGGKCKSTVQQLGKTCEPA